MGTERVEIMAKQGMHNHDSRDSDVSRGPNKHEKSQTITTGSYKKPETYKEQQYEHKDPEKQAQEDKNTWVENTLIPSDKDDRTRARDSDLTERNKNKYLESRKD